MTSSSKTILIIDDDIDFTEALFVLLKKHGFRILKAHNGREGLKLAKTALPDLVLVDIMMEERTEGFFTVQEIRKVKELRRVPIFVLSSLYSKVEEFDIPPENKWLAHDEFFSKPVDTKQLLDAINRRLSAGDSRNRKASSPQRK